MKSRRRSPDLKKRKKRIGRRVERELRREDPAYTPSESAIQEAEVVRVARMIDRSSLVQQLEGILVPNPQLGGRARTLPIRTYLIVAILNATGNRVLTGPQMLEVATRDLPGYIQCELGIRDERGRILVTLRMFRYLLSALERQLGTRNVSNPVAKTSREQLHFDLIQSFVAASIPRGIQWATTQSLDATALRTFGRARKDLDKRADKDAHWGACTRMGQYKSESKTQIFFGYDLHLTAATRAVGGSIADQPELITGMQLVPAATDVVDATMPLIRHQREVMGDSFDEIIVDRAYSYKLPERWLDELSKLGIAQVADLHPLDQGARDYEGMQIIAGCAHCPFTPEHLASIPRPSPTKKKPQVSLEEKIAFETEIEQRQRYSLRLVANGETSERRQCPALAGKVRCTTRPETIDTGDDLPLVEGPSDMETAPKVCQQSSVTIPHSALGKMRQPLYWGSTAWLRSFDRRTVVERKNGDLKQPITNNLQHGTWQVMGKIKNSIMAALCVIANNLRIARQWAARHDKTHLDSDLLSPDPDYTPNMTAPPNYRGLPPPTAA